MKFALLLAVVVVLRVASAETFFKEQFDDEGWRDRWQQSIPEGKTEEDMGEWIWTTGDWYGDENSKGIQTSVDAKHFGLIAKLDKPVTNDGTDLVLQYSVRNEQKVDCAGAYVKLLGPDVDEKTFGGDSPYQIMFGPDVCGTSRKTHLIFNYPPKDENLLIKKELKMENDQLSHLYTLHIMADDTFEVFIDNKSVKKGKLEEDFDFLLPREIKDPEASKPVDWVDEKMIPDPEALKPEGWDDIPAVIPDPEAQKPEDWSDEDDGEWEPPSVDNPDYKGEWEPKMIENPDYQGEWKHPMIPNPDFIEDDKLHKRCDQCTHIGFELWQVKTGTIFDDILVTDSLEEAQSLAEDFLAKKDAEKAMYDDLEEERKEKEKEERDRKKKEREEKKKVEEEEKKRKEAEEAEEVDEEADEEETIVEQKPEVEGDVVAEVGDEDEENEAEHDEL